MKNHLRTLLVLPSFLAAMAAGVAVVSLPAGAATPPPVSTPVPSPASSTAPGTAVNNTATASYTDGGGTSYTSTSNQVQTFVQNAPSLVVTTNNGTSPGTTTQNQNAPQGPIVLNDTINDNYTLTNTGNSSGYFQLGSGTSTVSASGTFQNIIITGTDGVAHAFATVSAANTYLSTTTNTNVYGLAPGAYINLAIQYKVTTGGPTTVGTTVALATISYPGTGSNYGVSTSNAVSNTYTDTVVADARLDVQKTAGTITGNSLTYTIDANNGGAAPAQLLQSISGNAGATITGSAFSTTNNGILITDKIPVNAGTPLTVSGVAITKAIVISGDTATIVYTTDSTGKTGWTTTAPAAGSAYFVGIYIQGTAPIPAAPGSSTGSVTNAQAAVEFTVTLSNLPSGTAVLNDATTAYADNAGFLEGPGITPATTSNVPTSNPAVAYNTAPLTGNSGGNGLSNTTTSNVPGVLNGPKGAAGASGCYNTAICSSNSTNTDFTQASLGVAGTYGATLAAGTFVNVPSDIENTSGSNDTYSFTFPSLPSGVVVTGLYTDYACTNLATKDGSGNYQISVSAGATAPYCVKYTSVSGASAPSNFTPIYVQVLATSQTSSSFTNATYHVLMPGGFISLHKIATVISTGCPTGATVPANGICPTGVVQYQVVYANTLPLTTVSGAGNVPESMSAGTLKITEDGGAGTNTWALYTNGLKEAMTTGSSVANTCGATAGTCGDTTASSTFAAVTSTSTANNLGNAIGSNAFVDTVGGTTFVLVPGASGTLYFAVVAK